MSRRAAVVAKSAEKWPFSSSHYHGRFDQFLYAHASLFTSAAAATRLSRLRASNGCCRLPRAAVVVEIARRACSLAGSLFSRVTRQRSYRAHSPFDTHSAPTWGLGRAYARRPCAARLLAPLRATGTGPCPARVFTAHPRARPPVLARFPPCSKRGGALPESPAVAVADGDDDTAIADGEPAIIGPLL